MEDNNYNADRINKTSPAGFKEEHRKVARWSIIFPLLLASLLFGLDFYSNFRMNSFCFDKIYFWTSLNNYFDGTLISIASFALLQQFFLFIPAGFDDKKGIILFLSTMFYFGFYVLYLTSSTVLVEEICMVVLDVCFTYVLWTSLDVETCNIDASSFSGRKQTKPDEEKR